jgi:anti-anti-sigma factor
MVALARKNPFEVQFFQVDGVPVVYLAGVPVVRDAERLERLLTPLIAQHPPTIVLDLVELDTLPSLVLGVLAGFVRSVVRRGSVVCVTGLQPDPRQIAEIGQVEEFFSLIGRSNLGHHRVAPRLVRQRV